MTKKEVFEKIMSTRESRIRHSKRNILVFAMIYMPEAITYDFAKFHHNMEYDLFDDNCRRMLVAMFRGSAKTSICGMVYALWCIAFEKRHYIIFASDTDVNASANMANLVNQMQTNTLLINDFGHLFYEDTKIAQRVSHKKTIKDFVTTNGIRVNARGTGQKVRGALHQSHRPDLFIGDDLEGIKSVREVEQREKLDSWLHAEVMPAMDNITGKMIILGNVLHADSLICKLRDKPDVWNVHWIPIHDENGVCAWDAKWVMTEEECKAKNEAYGRLRYVSVESERRSVGYHQFNQEYLLQPLAEEDRVIHPSWINHYKPQDIDWADYSRFRILMAIDPAIAEHRKADCTAMTVWAYDLIEDNYYCLDYFNERVDFDTIKETARAKYNYWGCEFCIIETQQAQDWLAQDLKKHYGMNVKPLKRGKGDDKRVRLIEVSDKFTQGRVFFKEDQKIVTDQIVGLGNMKHDDLVDTVSDAIKHCGERKKSRIVKTNVSF